MLQSISRIILIRLRMIGDVLLTTPAVHALRRHFPKAQIVYLTGKFAKDVLLNNPDIDEILVYGPGIFRKILEHKVYDLAINFDGGPESEILCFLSRAKYRVGLSGKDTAIHINSEIYNIYPNKLSPASDIIDCFLDLIRALGLKALNRKTRLYLTEREKTFAERYLKQHNLEKYIILGIHPGGHGSKNLWGGKKFARLVDELISRYGFMVFIFQGPGEETIAEDVYHNIKQKHLSFLVSVLTLRKYISLVNACKIFIAHDGGPMHISASLGIKTIGIFSPHHAPFSPHHAPFWFPYQDEKNCVYLQKGSVKDITVGEVLEATRKILTCTSSRSIHSITL